MAKLDIRGINYITASGKQNTFNLDIAYTDDGHIKAAGGGVRPEGFNDVHTRTFFGNVGEEESMSERYRTNFEAMYDTTHGIIIHPLYDLSKTKLKQSTNVGTTSEKVEIFAPTMSGDFVDVVQFENFAYGLSPRLDVTPTILSAQFNHRSTTDYSFHYQYNNISSIDVNLYPIINRDLAKDEPTISTYQLYIQEGGDPELSAKRVEEVFTPARTYAGVKYNYVFEIPENTEYNDYEKGYIQCNVFLAKNHLDTQFDMNSPNNKDRNDLSIGLSCTRDYIGLGVCGSKMFMKYRDNIDYPTSCDVYDGQQNTSAIKRLHHYTDEQQRGYSYQHVDVVQSLHRYATTTNGHKSSMYSLRLTDTGLNSSGISEVIKEKLRQNITNNIRMIAEKICPAHTQLFNVYFEGK